MSDFDSLVGSLLGIPKLAGASCVGRWEMFDPVEPGESPEHAAARQAAAQKICSACPALTPCAEWVDNLRPSKRPLGVIAGRINTGSTRTRKAS